MSALRILLIEDNADDAELIALALEDAGLDHELCRVELRHELDAALQRDDWSIVVCDSRLPGYTGAEALKSVGRAAREEIFALFPELRERAETEQPAGARLLASGRTGRKLAVRHAQHSKPLLQ